MYDTLALPELDNLVTAEQAKKLEQDTAFTLTTALRAAAGCHEIKQIHGMFGNGTDTACALSAGLLVSQRLGYLG